MRFWLITVGEPLPTDSANERLLRTGMLATVLSTRGHDVVWWTSTFDHVRKQQRFSGNHTLAINEHYKIQLLYAKGYHRNISFARIRNHIEVANQFRDLAPVEAKPDVILCSYPTIELCAKATEFGIMTGVPVILDIRDLWPDVYLDSLFWPVKPFVMPFYWMHKRLARRALFRCKAICGITDYFVQWGYKLARRQQTSDDRVFYMGYSSQQPEKEHLEKARIFWNQKNLNGSQFIICFFGNVGPTIDLDPVIKAADLLRQESVPVKFIICGSGIHYGRYREKAKNLATIEFPGWVGKAEIWQLMNFSSFGLVPYRNVSNYLFNLPNKPIEYLAGGLPVLSSLKSGVLKETIEKNSCGIVYPNAKSLAALCKHYFNNRSAIKQLSDSARILYEKSFVAEKVYESMADYFESIA